MTRRIRVQLADSSKDVPRLLADLSIEAAKAGSAAILVVANTVENARQAFNKIAAKDKAARVAGQVLLLHGQQREAERAQVMERVRAVFGPDRQELGGTGPTYWYLVATQAIEVGADISADHMVTAVCPGDSLIQRLGRLGRNPSSRGAVYRCDVVVPEVKEARKRRSEWMTAYEQASGDVAQYLRTTAVGTEPQQGRGIQTVDIRPESEQARQIAAIPAPRTPAVPLWSPGMLALIQTRPAPINTPNVDALINGLGEEEHTAYLCWRADLTAGNENSWGELVDGWPVRPHEVIEVSLSGIRSWLSVDRGRHKLYVRAGGDRPGQAARVAEEPPRMGDVVVVPGSYGGHDGFGFNPTAPGPVTDLADTGGDHLKGLAVTG